MNATPIEVAPGATVREALLAHDPGLARRAAEGSALITDARGIELPLDAPLAAGSIVRALGRARRGEPDADAHA